MVIGEKIALSSVIIAVISLIAFVVYPMLYASPITPVTLTPAPIITSTPTSIPVVTSTITPAPAKPTEANFRVGPTVRLRPVTEVIDSSRDGIIELYMDNPSLNDVTLHADVRISVPAGIHIHGEGFGLAGAAGTVYGIFNVPPGTVRTIAVLIKADESARLGQHTLQFSGLYYPGDNKDLYNQISLTYPITVKEASKKPESAEPSNPDDVPKSAATPAPTPPGFEAIFAIGVIATVVLLLRRK